METTETPQPPLPEAFRQFSQAEMTVINKRGEVESSKKIILCSRPQIGDRLLGGSTWEIPKSIVRIRTGRIVSWEMLGENRVLFADENDLFYDVTITRTAPSPEGGQRKEVSSFPKKPEEEEYKKTGGISTYIRALLKKITG